MRPKNHRLSSIRAGKHRLISAGLLAVTALIGAGCNIGGGGGGGPSFEPRPAAPAFVPAAPSPDPTARGALLFKAQGCELCHAAGGVGGVANANAESGGQINALLLVKEGYTPAQLEQRLREGVAEVGRADKSGPIPPLRMPAYGSWLTDQQVSDLAAYVLSLYPKDRAPADDDWDDDAAPEGSGTRTAPEETRTAPEETRTAPEETRTAPEESAEDNPPAAGSTGGPGSTPAGEAPTPDDSNRPPTDRQPASGGLHPTPGGPGDSGPAPGSAGPRGLARSSVSPAEVQP